MRSRNFWITWLTVVLALVLGAVMAGWAVLMLPFAVALGIPLLRLRSTPA
ncbi:MAG: hypothetical protein ACKOJ9_09820 [Actinomycetota bacterium]